MKVLFSLLADHSIRFNPTVLADYMSDSIFHGLRSLLGSDLVDYPFPMLHMYKSYKQNNKLDIHRLWGKGFTLYGNLPDIDIDRNDIPAKIDNKYFDYLIIGLHYTQQFNVSALHNIISTYRNKFKKIVVIDGWDVPQVHRDIAQQCVYMKRELNEGDADVAKPISFAIPAEKITAFIPEKTADFAYLIPPTHGSAGSPHFKTYIYNDERSYYSDYARSYFGFTCKKGGWDCLRHYEIIATGCIPYFSDIEKCPKLIMHTFPKELCIQAKKLSGVAVALDNGESSQAYIGTTEHVVSGVIDYNLFNKQQYIDLLHQFINYAEDNLTTLAEAKRLIDRINND